MEFLTLEEDYPLTKLEILRQKSSDWVEDMMSMHNYNLKCIRVEDKWLSFFA